MKRNVMVAVALCAVALLASVAQADTKTDAAAKLSYDVPAGFKEEKEGKLTMYSDPKEEMAFIVMPTDAKNQDAAMNELTTTMDALVKDIKPVKSPTGGTTNKLKNLQFKATGTYKGKPVNMTVRMYVNDQAKPYFVIVGMYLAEKKDALKDIFNTFFNSVRPAA